MAQTMATNKVFYIDRYDFFFFFFFFFLYMTGIYRVLTVKENRNICYFMDTLSTFSLFRWLSDGCLRTCCTLAI